MRCTYVEKGSSATFLGTARFIGNSVISTDLPPIMVGDTGGLRNNYIPRDGGAVFNKVRKTSYKTSLGTRTSAHATTASRVERHEFIHHRVSSRSASRVEGQELLRHRAS